MTRAQRKGLRTALQGALLSAPLTAAVSLLVGGLKPWVAVVVVLVSQSLVAWAQNGAEDRGLIPTVLPSPPPGTTDAPLMAPR